ncbi:MAG: hypothetical protein O3B24_09540 [Verrucomicrobia bacterium]|nr:hypothetical protein [Verrucomicrobiota bacterium]
MTGSTAKCLVAALAVIAITGCATQRREIIHKETRVVEDEPVAAPDAAIGETRTTVETRTKSGVVKEETVVAPDTEIGK